MDAGTDLVVGLDMGGTSTRALLADAGGRRLGTGRGGAGNPVTHPVERVAASLTAAVHEALRGHDPDRVALGLVGMAGAGRLADPAVRTVINTAWHDAGPRCPLRVVGDPEVAFAAASATPDGTLLIAGTGSACARMAGHAMARYVGGHGWLLGDEGSAFWLGRQAVRALLTAADGRVAEGELTALVRDALAAWPAPHRPAGRRTTEWVIDVVTASEPVRMANLAPLVGAAAAAGDPVAADIVRRAAAHLADLVATVRSPGDAGPIVFTGGVLTPGTPVDTALRGLLAERFDAPVRAALDGAAGAAWLALRTLDGDRDLDGPHRALTG